MDLHTDIGAIWSASDLDTASKAVLTVVRYHADDEGNCRITVDQIAKFASMHRTNVIRRMADLVARKLIEREIDRRGGNVYRVRPDGWQMDQSSHTATTVVAHSDHSSRTQLLQKSHTATTEVAPSDHRTIEVVNCSHVATRTTELQNETTTASTARAPTRETLAPHPMPKPVDHGGSDRVDHELRAAAIIGRHPSADRLTPMAVEAIRILRVDPSIFVLEQWLTRGYSLPRIVAGCTFAASKFHGQTVPAGELVNSATRWMNRATPDEYGEGSKPAGQSFSAPKPQRPHSSAGIWQKFGMPIPEPNRGTDGEF